MADDGEFGRRDHQRRDPPYGTHAAFHGDEHGGLAAVLLQQLAGEHPAAWPSGVQALRLDRGPQFAQGTLPPGQQVRPVDHRPDGRRRGGGHAAVLDRSRAVRRLQQLAQGLDRGPRLGQLAFQPVQVRSDERVAGGRVRCGQHRLNVGDRHLKVAQPPDDLRGRDLVGRVVPVARVRVHRGRYDGDYDKANLPDELILTNYFTVRDGRILTLIVIRNTPSSY